MVRCCECGEDIDGEELAPARCRAIRTCWGCYCQGLQEARADEARGSYMDDLDLRARIQDNLDEREEH